MSPTVRSRALYTEQFKMIKKISPMLLIFMSVTTYSNLAMSQPVWKDYFYPKRVIVASACRTTPCRSTNGVSHCSACQCTDLYRHLNDCMSDARFCEAFGNVGGR